MPWWVQRPTHWPTRCHKVTIIPRPACVHTARCTMTDKTISAERLVDHLAMGLAGAPPRRSSRRPSTGAPTTFRRSPTWRAAMVMEYGMSDRLGPMKYG